MGMQERERARARERTTESERLSCSSRSCTPGSRIPCARWVVYLPEGGFAREVRGGGEGRREAIQYACFASARTEERDVLWSELTNK